MCQRKENEPLLVYFMRYLTEQPQSIMAVVGFAAAAYMYVDLMDYVRENTTIMRDLKIEMHDANAHLKQLERYHFTDQQDKVKAASHERKN